MFISQVNFCRIKLEAEPQRDQDNYLMISEVRISHQVEFQKIPTPKIISQPKKVSKIKSQKSLGQSFFQIEM